MSLNSEIASPVRTDNAITALYSTARDVQHEMRVELNKVWNSYMVFTIEQSILSPQVSRKHNPSPNTEMQTGRLTLLPACGPVCLDRIVYIDSSLPV